MGLIKRVIKKDMYFGAKTEVFDLALRMRKHPTEGEKAMWHIIRKFRKSGFLFRRQHPIEFYIADFYCHKLRLVIEVDGEIHSEDEVHFHDEGRTGELERFGIKVLRFTNDQVLNDNKQVIEKITSYIKNTVLEEVSPSHPGGGGLRGRGPSVEGQRGRGPSVGRTRGNEQIV